MRVALVRMTELIGILICILFFNGMAAKTTIKTYKKTTKLPIKTPVKFIQQQNDPHKSQIWLF